MFFIRRTIQSDFNYQLVRCFSDIQDTLYGDRFLDFTGPDGFTTLSTGVFCWLINIRPWYLIFRQGNTCTIKPYLPSRFARLGYDQLYVGNPNTILRFSENLFEGARAWYFHVAGGTGATLFPNERHILILASASHLVCRHRYGAGLRDQYLVYQGYQIYLYCKCKGSKTTRKKEMNEYLEAKKEACIYEAVQESKRGAKTA